MKHALTIVLLMLMLCRLQAQNDSLTGSPLENTAYDEEVYEAPNINPIYYFGSPFSEHFAEAKLFLGTDDIGAGLSYCYIPEVWGFNISAYVHNTLWAVAGAEYRLSKPWNRSDWHLFGSVGVNYEVDFATVRPAMEVGARVTLFSTGNKFCLNSASVGVLTDFDGVYVTVGTSLSLSLIFMSLFFL